MPIKQTLNQDNGEWDRTRANRRGEPAWDFLGELWVSFGNPPSQASEQTPTGVETKHKLERKGDAGTFGKLWETLGNLGFPWKSHQNQGFPKNPNQPGPKTSTSRQLGKIRQTHRFATVSFYAYVCVGTYAFV